MKTYTTVQGDMWDSIAFRELGSTAYTDRLMRLNPQHRECFTFPAGVCLVLPEPEAQVSSTLPPWKRDGHGS